MLSTKPAILTCSVALLATLAPLATAVAKGPALDDIRRQVRAGEPIIVEALKTIGTIEAGKHYVVRFDPALKQMHVSQIDRSKLASYVFSEKDVETGVSLWGGRFAWRTTERGLCLDYDNERIGQRNVVCDARVVGPAVPNRFTNKRDLILIGTERLIAQLTQHLADPSAVVKRGRPCPSKPQLFQSHIAARFLADALYYNSGILPFITDPTQRAKAEGLVDRAVVHLMQTVKPTARTTAVECFTGIDLITPFQVTRALDQYYRFKPREDISQYIATLWPNLMAEDAIERNGARNAETRMQFANAFAAYLHVATIAERHGVKALQPWTERGVQLLLAEQVMERGRTCTDAKGRFEQPFGGWPHSPAECSQNTGYHGFIVGGLIALHDHYERTNVCRREAQKCRTIDRSLAAALDWIGGLAEGKGRAALVDRARRTSTIPSAPGSGNVGGADTGFRIAAHLGRSPDEAWGILVKALDESVEARPNHLPISSYLHAIAAARARDMRH